MTTSIRRHPALQGHHAPSDHHRFRRRRHARHHEKYFVATKDRFVELLADYAEPVDAATRLHDTEIANVGQYGFGVKKLHPLDDRDCHRSHRRHSPGCADQRDHRTRPRHAVSPGRPFPGVRETLETLKSTHKLLVVTRGDLFDQERKLAASGLLPFFDEIEIVSDKTQPVYERIFTRHGDGPGRAMMIGNSMRADVVPAPPPAPGASTCHRSMSGRWTSTRNPPTPAASAACPTSPPCCR